MNKSNTNYSNISYLSFSKELFASNNLETIHTIPSTDKKAPFTSFIKVSKEEEVKVCWGNDLVNTVLRSGYEITKEEYEKSEANEDIACYYK